MLINLSLMTPGKPLFEFENTVDCAWPFSAFESAMIASGEDVHPAVAATTLSGTLSRLILSTLGDVFAEFVVGVCKSFARPDDFSDRPNLW
jgi:hypothetical protein